MQVEYLAAVMQQTGEDWQRVDLILSTAQPMLNAAPPELQDAGRRRGAARRSPGTSDGAAACNRAGAGGMAAPAAAANGPARHGVQWWPTSQVQRVLANPARPQPRI